ncbi:hypothetical protein X797_000653 [Metarhizium robertsii]|uniref:Uncharacterized protein n=1 Tax=Metarhizium robertsii TaxID=568076 RepID=A0A0A1V8M5_9HYPO|nr:hypothetical protein X797_000653 [Metarhizium robertsii]
MRVAPEIAGANIAINVYTIVLCITQTLEGSNAAQPSEPRAECNSSPRLRTKGCQDILRHVTTADSRLVQDDQDDISKSGAQQRVEFVLCQCENIPANGELAEMSIYNAEAL